jgi:hypothetical protein
VAQEQAKVGLGPDDKETPKFLQQIPDMDIKRQKKAEKNALKAAGKYNKEKEKEKEKEKKKEKTEKAKAPQTAPKAKKKEEEYLVLLLGDAGVGKTALLERYLTGSFKANYVHTRFEIHSAEVSYHGIRLHLKVVPAHWQTDFSS